MAHKPKAVGPVVKHYEPGEMSEKAKQLDEQLRKAGVDAPALLKAGKNPMAALDRPRYFKIACNLLLQEGCLNRDTLRSTLMKDLVWSAMSANSHISIIASYLMATGVVALSDDGKTYVRVAR